MRIALVVCGTKRYFGLPKYFYFLARNLVKEGVDVTLIVDSSQGALKLLEVFGEPYEHYYRDSGFLLNFGETSLFLKVIGPETGGVLNAPKTLLWCYNVAQYLKKQKNSFDILHTGHITPLFYLMQKDRNPVIFQPFGNELFTLPNQTLYHKLAQPLLGYCGSRADLLAMEGDFQLKETLDIYKIPEDRTFVLPIGIDIPFIESKAEGPKGEWRTRMFLKGGEFVFLTVNGLYPWKGIDILINAFQVARPYIRNPFLIIIGEGPEKGRLEDLIIEKELRDEIVIISRVPEAHLYEYYKASDVYVSPTLVKDFLMGILEAEVFGLPIISTGQEWLVKHKENGLLVTPGDAQGLASSMVGMYQLSKEERQKMGKVSKGIVKKYDFKEIAEKAIKTYKELLR